MEIKYLVQIMRGALDVTAGGYITQAYMRK